MTRDYPGVIPLRFGAPSRGLFGLFHPAAGAAERAECVVICNPFGQEAIRAHRLLRIVAERLADAGFPVLRFDYHGTGDSDGDESSASLAAWADDILSADLEARRMSGHPHAAWFGLRLGATLAAMASERARREPRRLVLWDPLVNGKSYLQDLFRSQREHLAEARVPERWDPGAEGDTEVFGFPIPATLRREIVSVEGSGVLTTSRAARTVVLASDGFEGLPLLRSESLAGHMRLHCIGTRVAWDTEEALDAALVPAEALHAILQSMMEPL
jgi:pimeloyl-ACP methyl ester carboxylesterase